MLLTIVVMFSAFIYALVIRKKYSIIFNCPKCNNSLINPELHPDKGYIGNMKAVLEVSINNIQNMDNCRNCGLDLDSQENEL